jgi:hypothetical protein
MNQVRHFLWLIHLNEMSSTRQEEELGTRKQLRKVSRHTSVQIRIRIPENDSDGRIELLQFGDELRARSYSRQ